MTPEASSPCSALHPLHAISALHPLHAGSALHPLHAISALHPLHAISALHPLHAISALHPLHAISALHSWSCPPDSLLQPDPYCPVVQRRFPTMGSGYPELGHTAGQQGRRPAPSLGERFLTRMPPAAPDYTKPATVRATRMLAEIRSRRHVRATHRLSSRIRHRESRADRADRYLVGLIGRVSAQSRNRQQLRFVQTQLGELRKQLPIIQHGVEIQQDELRSVWQLVLRCWKLQTAQEANSVLATWRRFHQSTLFDPTVIQPPQNGIGTQPRRVQERHNRGGQS